MDIATIGRTALSPLNTVSLLITIVLTFVAGRIFYMQTLHPLSHFPGPWYATSFSIVGAIISVKKKEHDWFMYLVGKYGSKFTIGLSTWIF